MERTGSQTFSTKLKVNLWQLIHNTLYMKPQSDNTQQTAFICSQLQTHKPSCFDHSEIFQRTESLHHTELSLKKIIINVIHLSVFMYTLNKESDDARMITNRLIYTPTYVSLHQSLSSADCWFVLLDLSGHARPLRLHIGQGISGISCNVLKIYPEDYQSCGSLEAVTVWWDTQGKVHLQRFGLDKVTSVCSHFSTIPYNFTYSRLHRHQTRTLT